MSRNVHTLVAFAGLAVSATAQAETWANNAAGGTQTWATGANWIGGVPPISDINTSLVFHYNFSSTAQTAQNNIGAGTFNLNSIVMNNESAGGLTLSALAAANTLTFVTNGAAVAPSLTNSSSVAATISAGLVLGNDLTIGGAGNGNLTLSGIVSGAAGLNLSTTGAGVVALNGANTFVGATTINSGNVSVGNAAAFGAAGNTVTYNGGSLRFTTAVTLAQNFVLNNTLNLTGTVNGTFSGVLSGAGGINLRAIGTTAATNTFTFQGANTFTGMFDARPSGIVTGVTSVLSGANGAFSNVSGVTLAGNQTLQLDSGTTNNLNRLNDSAGISLHRSSLVLTGNSAGTTETVGAITFSGASGLAVTPNSASNSALTAASITRADRGALILTGTNLGGTGANSSNIIATSNANITGALVGGGGAGGTTTISILPYAYAVNTVTTASGQLVTYDNSLGFRPLTASEYVTTLKGIQNTTSASNVKTNGAPNIGKGTTMNALAVDTASASTIGSGVYAKDFGPSASFLTPTSGVLMFSLSGGATAAAIPSIVSTNLDFGGAEAMIHAQTNGAITGKVSGFGGLTKSGLGALSLMGANNYQGTTTIDGGSLIISSDAALGDASNSIFLNSGPIGGLVFAPSVLFGASTATSVSIARNITLGAAGGGLQTQLANTNMLVSGDITGSGNLYSGVNTVGNIGALKLTGNNTYTGTTFVQGNLAVNSDANLGVASDLVMAGGFLRNDAAFSTSKNILIAPGLTLTGATFFTNGFDMTLNGAISNVASGLSIIKGGSNALNLTADNAFNGTLQVGLAAPLGDQSSLGMGGSVVLTGANGALRAAPTANVLGGSTLVLDNVGANNANRLNANVTLGGGTLEFRGNGAAASTETIGSLTAGNFAPAVGNGVGIVNIAPGSGQSAVLTASNFARTGFGAMLVRGSNLGGAIGADTANLVFNTAPTLTNGIIAGMVGDTSLAGNGSGFVTHAAGTGVRLLTVGEYSAMPLSGVTTVNADTTSANILSGATTVNSLRMGAGGGVDATGQTLTVTSGMIMANGGANSGIVGGTLAFGSAPATIWANDNLAVGSVMTGSGGLNKAGVGNLTLSGASTLTGGVVVSNGTLTYGVANALGTANAMTLGATGSSVGSLDLNGLAATFASIGGFGNINLNGATLTSAGGSTLFSGAISGSGAINLNGAMTLAGNLSSFTGDFTVANSGVLTVSANQASNAGPGPLGAGNLVLGNSTQIAQLSFGSNVSTFNKNIVVAANTNASFPQINQNASSNVSLGGTITLNRSLRLNGGFSTASPFAGCVTLAGDISGVGGLDWFGGNFNLNGNNTFTGVTNLFPGSADPESVFLGIGTNSALGTGNVTVGTAAGNLRADNGARSLANNFYFTSSSASRMGFAGVNDMTLTGQIDLGGGAFAGATPPSLAGARTIHVTNSGTTTFAGIVSGATAATLTKNGGGRLVMSGANTFAGNVTVNAGSLYVNGTNSGAGSYTVNANALLGGNGTITGAVSINAGGILEPGNSAGTLSTGNLTLAGGAYMIWELGDPTAPSASDLAAVSGNLNIAAGTGSVLLNIELLPSFYLQPVSTTWVIMTYSGTLTGSAANFTLGALPSFVTSATIDTTSNPGQVLLTLVPTPGAAALFGVAGLGAFRRRRTA